MSSLIKINIKLSYLKTLKKWSITVEKSYFSAKSTGIDPLIEKLFCKEEIALKEMKDLIDKYTKIYKSKKIKEHNNIKLGNKIIIKDIEITIN